MIRSALAGAVSMSLCGFVAAEVHVINQVGFSFQPPEVYAEAGDTVTWIWNSGSHTATSGSGCIPSGLFSFGLFDGAGPQSWVIPANTPSGTIPFFCFPHCTFMTGKIHVGLKNSCPADLDFNDVVDFNDLVSLLNDWGPCDGSCPRDINGDGEVGFGDLLELLSAWGPCPAP